MKYIVLPDRSVTHADVTYSAGEEFDIDKDIGNFHERLGSCRKYDPDLDDLPQVDPETPHEIEGLDEDEPN
jgi:hypothetical protein